MLSFRNLFAVALLFLAFAITTMGVWYQEVQRPRSSNPSASYSFGQANVFVSTSAENVTNVLVNVKTDAEPLSWFTIEAEVGPTSLQRADITSWRNFNETKSMSVFFRGQDRTIEALNMTLSTEMAHISYYDLNFDGIWDYRAENSTLASGENQVREYIMLDNAWRAASGNCVPAHETPKLNCDGVTYLFSDGSWRPSPDPNLK